MRGLLRYIHGKRRAKNDVQETLKAVSNSLQLKVEGEKTKLAYSRIRSTAEGSTAVASIMATLNNRQDVWRLNKAR